MRSQKCSRCGEEPAAVWMQDSGRCRACFLAYMRRSFKTNLGRAGAGGRPTGLALAISGGPSSASLALLMSHYVASLVRNPRAPPARLVLLHVCADAHEPPPAIDAVRAAVPEAEYREVCVAKDYVEDLAGVKDASDRGMLARAEVLRAVCTGALEMGCDKVLLGTSANRTAVDVIDRTVSGRGASVHTVSAASCQSWGITVVRPLRDIPVRLLVRYGQMMLPNTTFAAEGALGLLGEGLYRKGLYDVIERFVEEAGDDNQSAVHNVVRTAARLLPNEKESPCEHCGGSELAPEQDPNADSCCDSCSCNKQSTVCYACRSAAKRATPSLSNGPNPIELLFSRSLEREQRQRRMEDMRKSIQEFLI